MIPFGCAEDKGDSCGLMLLTLRHQVHGIDRFASALS